MGIAVRKGQGDVKLTREEFERRLRERFYDPEFKNVERQIGEVIDVACRAYDEYRKSPRKPKAGPGFADSEIELPIEWLERWSHDEFIERWESEHVPNCAGTSYGFDPAAGRLLREHSSRALAALPTRLRRVSMVAARAARSGRYDSLPGGSLKARVRRSRDNTIERS